MKKVPFIKPGYFSIALRPILQRYERYIKRGFYNSDTGEIAAFEKKICSFIGSKYCVAVSSGTTGLIIALKALNISGNVLVPSFTFSATAHAVTWNSLLPKFVDIDIKTFNIDPEQVIKRIDAKTSAILAVHMFGNPCNIDELQKIAKRFKLKIIFDSAHAFGSKYNGRPIGTFGDLEVFSFHATKLFSTIEGGAVVTNDRSIYYRLKTLRQQGNRGDGNCIMVGLNGRMPQLNAIIGLENIKNINSILKKRTMLARYYTERLRGIPGLRLQNIADGSMPSFQFIPVIIDRNKFGCSRDYLAEFLEKKGISTRKYFYPVHKFNCYKDIETAYGLPNTEYISRNILCLPCYNSISKACVDRICKTLISI